MYFLLAKCKGGVNVISDKIFSKVMIIMSSVCGIMLPMRIGRIVGIVLTAALCALSLVASADDSPRATGYRPPTRGVAMRRVGSAQKSRLLRVSSRTTLPSKWNSCEQGWVSPVKNQGNVGACWAFAAYATLETQLLMAGKGEWDFSEKNMVNLHGWNLGPNEGGNSDIAAAYLLRWGGAVEEANDRYKTSIPWPSSPLLSPVVHVQHVVWTEELDGTEERMDALKTAIMEYGAVATSICWSNNFARGETYYYTGSGVNNHAVAFVGWDDDYPTNNFQSCPPGPGAWIIKNSWGTSSGSNGFYRVSYHDMSLARGEPSAVFIPAGEGEDYDAVRGYDRLGYVYDPAQYYSTSAAAQCRWQASVFTATWNERLDAVGIWTTVFPMPYEILIYTNVTRGASSPTDGGTLACRQSGILEHAGFTTIPLSAGVSLADGTSFAVVYHQTGDEISLCVNCTTIGLAYPVHARGNSYFGRDEGGAVEWIDGMDADDAVDDTDESWATCIKAYTRSMSPSRTGDAPLESDDGTKYLADLGQTNATLFAETAGTFGASVGLVGANGRSLWTSWLSGLDPSVEGDAEFTVSIDVSGGVPSLTWSPDLGDARAYTVWGRETLDAADSWAPVDIDDIGMSPFRFFKVTVGQ